MRDGTASERAQTEETKPSVEEALRLLSKLEKQMNAMAPSPVDVRERTRSRAWTVAAAMILADSVGVFLAAIAGVLVRFAIGGTFDLSYYFWHASPMVGVFILTFAITDLYPGIALNPVVEIQRIAKAVTITYLSLIALTFFQRDVESYSRIAILLAWLFTLVLVPVSRMLVRSLFASKPWWGASTVIFGGGRTGQHLAHTLQKHPEFGVRVIGILDDENYGGISSASSVAPLLGPFKFGPELATSFGIHYAILALPEISSRQLSEIVERYASSFHDVLIIPDFFGLSTLGLHTRDLGGVLGVEVNNRLLYRFPRFFKRLFDLLVAGSILVIFSPLFALIWLLIRCTSPGPAFYSQERAGEGGKGFRVWKFRSMYRNGEKLLQRRLAESEEARRQWEREHKIKNDPRVTPVGRILRKTSLDELPQLWNVLLGEMSMVGPRPIERKEVETYGDKYSLYQRVQPGLSGLWQVSGRSNTTYEERVLLDAYYIRNWSIWLDLFILVKTIRVVLKAEGAY